jgi:hypothetical protein
MKTRTGFPALGILLVVLILPACSYVTVPSALPPASNSPVPTETLVPTSTPDPCAPANFAAQVQVLNALTRRFDDAASIARNSKQDQIAPDIAALQSVRRDAEQLQVPACLSPLKDVQLVYMNTFIQTLLGFQGGAGPDQVTQGIAVSGQLHDQYMLVMMRMLGQPAASLPQTMPGAPPPADAAATATPTPSIPVITNPGPDTVRVFTRPVPNALGVGSLAAGQSALALAQTGDGAWIMIEIPGWPGQTAWVSAAQVQWSGPGVPPIIAAP